VNLSNEDIRDILSLLDSLPYSEFTLETSRFTLRLRRSAEGGWTQETQVTSQPVLAGPVARAAPSAGPVTAGEPGPSGRPTAPGEPPSPACTAGTPSPPGTPSSPGVSPSPSVSPSSDVSPSPGDSPFPGGPSVRDAPPSSEHAADLIDIVAPLPGTFYRAPQPGAPPFVDTGGHVEPTTVVAIIETMKLMNPVYAGTAGTVTQICLDDGQFAGQGTVLMRVSPRGG
jgi:biotin carboxyl carrier protein